MRVFCRGAMREALAFCSPRCTTGVLYHFRRQPVTPFACYVRRSWELTQLVSVARHGLAGQSVSQGVILLTLVVSDLAHAKTFAYVHGNAFEGFFRPSSEHVASEQYAAISPLCFSFSALPRCLLLAHAEDESVGA